jgi:CubicO group peptidase (beta-lactamase class C family)
MTSPGWAIGIIKQGKLVFAQGYGAANLATQEIITPQSNFRLASLTKPFTALAILQLIQQRKIGLDDTIKNYLDLSPALGNVTVQQLLSHTGGVPDHEGLLKIQKLPVEPTTQDAILTLEDKTPIFPPGSRTCYSDAGYVLLAGIIESVTSCSYASYVQTTILTPLGMKTSIVADSPSVSIPHRVIGYMSSGGTYKENDYNRFNYIMGDEGIYSSIKDLARWEKVWRTDILLSSKIRDVAMTPTTLRNGTKCKYGLGWLTGTWHGQRIVYHDGEWVGFRTIFCMIPDRHLTIIALSNVAIWNTEEDRLRMALTIADIINAI